MELIVICALGIVLYCGYLTMRDIIADLVQEGVLTANPLEGLVEKWRCAAAGHFSSTGVPQRARLARSSFILLPSRPGFIATRHLHPAEARLYRSH